MDKGISTAGYFFKLQSFAWKLIASLDENDFGFEGHTMIPILHHAYHHDHSPQCKPMTVKLAIKFSILAGFPLLVSYERHESDSWAFVQSRWCCSCLQWIKCHAWSSLVTLWRHIAPLQLLIIGKESSKLRNMSLQKVCYASEISIHACLFEIYAYLVGGSNL